MQQEVTDEQREIIVDLAGLARPWFEIIEASGCSQHICERVLREADLWPKPTLDWQAIRAEEEDPPWFPPPGSKEYPDEFELKPEDRARLEEVRRKRRLLEGEIRKTDGTARKKRHGSHDYGRKKQWTKSTLRNYTRKRSTGGRRSNARKGSSSS